MEFDISQFYESVALCFMSLTIDLYEEKTFHAVKLGEDVHFKVRNDAGEVLLQVVGRDYNDLGGQLVLSCLHKTSVDRLVALRMRPLLKVATPPLRAV